MTGVGIDAPKTDLARMVLDLVLFNLILVVGCQWGCVEDSKMDTRRNKTMELLLKPGLEDGEVTGETTCSKSSQNSNVLGEELTGIKERFALPKSLFYLPHFHSPCLQRPLHLPTLSPRQLSYALTKSLSL